MADHTETAEIIKSIPLFVGLGRRDRDVLAKTSRHRRLEAFSRLMTQGEMGESCFVLLNGTAEVVRNSQKVTELQPGAVVGELSLIDGSERTADVTMLTRGEVLEVRKEGFDRLLESSSSAARSIVEQLCARVRALDTTVFG